MQFRSIFAVCRTVATMEFRPGQPPSNPDRHLTGTCITRWQPPRKAACPHWCASVAVKKSLKSNQGIAEELARISDPLLGSDRGCTRKDCENHGESAEEHPKSYHKLGYDRRTGRPPRGCKACGGRFLIGADSSLAYSNQAKVAPGSEI